MKAYISRNFMKLLVEYYNNAYDTNIFVLPEDLNLDGDEVFSSTISKKYENSSRIFAKFANEDEVNMYSGQVQFFFEHYLNYLEESTKHSLAYVHWYKKIQNKNLECHFSIGKKDDKFCKGTQARAEVYLVHNILKRFVAGTFTVGSRKHQDYMLVIPLNRKYNI
ncbi:hypothetical protein C2G38_2068718 [Gigaspora rosea]|uniref:Uncharacterized protein n=1 Tax=Gigaspora rosea TaxID=44941 RepID=A0A397VT80_9GLOM|nr:hypothetical protein C2G38_2068718 [Gigaspora rosea]